MSLQNKYFDFGLTVLLAFLPSLYILLTYPPFFNGIDATCYFVYPWCIPHYPPLYPLYCTGFLKLFGDGKAIVWSIILFQHLFYGCSIVYIAMWFRNILQRVIFLVLVFFAFQSSLYVHGVYSESWAIISTGFMIGALLRICAPGNDRNKFWHYVFYTIAGVTLLLTRTAGMFLLFVLPLFTVLKSYREKNLFSVAVVKQLVKQMFQAIAVIAIAQIITTILLIANKAPDFAVYGRPGTYRIADALDQKCTFRNVNEVLAAYKSATTDTMVKITFDVIKSSDRHDLWLACYTPVDSIRKNFIGSKILEPNGPSTDAYLNAAYKIYLYNPQYYPYKAICFEFLCYVFDTKLFGEIAANCRSFITTNYNSMPPSTPLLKKYLVSHIQPAEYDKMQDDSLLAANGFFTALPVLLIVSFLIRRHLAKELRLLYLAVVLSAIGCLLITAIITAYIHRYTQPGEFMVYVMTCVLIANSVANKPQPHGS